MDISFFGGTGELHFLEHHHRGSQPTTVIVWHITAGYTTVGCKLGSDLKSALQRILKFTPVETRKGSVTKNVAVPMCPFEMVELATQPRRSVSLRYERSGALLVTTASIQEQLRKLMSKPEVREVIADLVARETIVEDANFSFHDLFKNERCYLVGCGINDGKIGASSVRRLR